jgi:hypothetical protein
VNAAAVVKFLADVSPGFASDKGDAWLSDSGAHGLYIVLTGVENTLKHVVNGM